MKKIFNLSILLFLSGCASQPDEVLSALLLGAVYFSIFLVGAVFYYFVRGAKLLVGITPEVEKENEKKKLKSKRKKYLKQISDDKKFIKRTYNQSLKNHKRKYPHIKHYSPSVWEKEKTKAFERIKQHENYIQSKKVQNLTDNEFIKLPFEKSGYTSYQIWVDRLARARTRVRWNKSNKKIKLKKVKDYETNKF